MDYANEVLTPQGLFRDHDTSGDFDLVSLVESLIKTASVKKYTALDDWIADSDIGGKTPAQIAAEWDNFPGGSYLDY